MSWLYLILAGVLEIGFTTTLKLSGGFSFQRPVYIALFTLFALASFGALNKSLADIPLGTAYAVWTGIGAFGTAVVGILFFSDPVTALRLLFLTLLIASIIGLKVVS